MDSCRKGREAVWLGPTSLVEDRERREISQAWGSFLNSDGFELDIRHHNSGVPHGHGEMTLLAGLKTNRNYHRAVRKPGFSFFYLVLALVPRTPSIPPTKVDTAAA